MVASKHVVNVDVLFDGDTKVQGDNGEVQLKYGTHIRHIHVDQRMDSPDYFTVTLQMMSQGEFLLLDSLSPGMEVEIKIGYDEKKTIFKGEVVYVEPSFSTEDHEIVVSGYDRVHFLTRGTNARTWGDGHQSNQNVGDVSNDVVNKSAASLQGSPSKSESSYEYIPQADVNDYQFLKAIGKTAFVDVDSASEKGAEKLAFRNPDLTAGPKITICREKKEGERLAESAEFTLSTAQQVKKVEVRGWNPKEKKAIKGEASSVSKTIEGQGGPKTAKQAHGGDNLGTVRIVDAPVASKSEADELAQSLFDQLALDYQKGTVAIEGHPDLNAGDTVELKGYGKRYGGKWFVEGAEHHLVSASTKPYTTTLHLARNAAPTKG